MRLREDGGPGPAVLLGRPAGRKGVPWLGTTESPDSGVRSRRARKHAALQGERPSRLQKLRFLGEP